MGKVITHMTMSLDGFVADSQDGVGELFEWYEAGEVEMSTPNPEVSFKVDGASAEMLKRLLGGAGALVAGRHLFDITNGWHDKHPAGVPVVVVTHRPPTDASQKWPTTSFINGSEPAIARAREIAGDKNVIVSSPTIIQQALNAGLVDQVWISLAPVLLGTGKPYFGMLEHGHVLLEDPEVVEGKRAVHLKYAVRRN